MKLVKFVTSDHIILLKEIKSLMFIFENLSAQKEKLLECISSKNANDIIGKIRLISNEVYSGCEIINQLLIGIYREDDRYRGTQLRRGFNDNFKGVYNASLNNEQEKREIYKDEFIHSFFSGAKTWFVDLHDIRTQETHYEVGRIEEIDDELYYINGNRNGTSKYIYSNPSNETKIKLSKFIVLIERFLNVENDITEFLISRTDLTE